MKRLSTTLALGLLTALHTSAAFAATGSNTGRLTTLLWYEGHNGLLVRQVGMSDLGGCGRSDYFIVDTTNVHFKEIYALLLSAYMADVPVTLDITDCTQGLSRVRHAQMSR